MNLILLQDYSQLGFLGDQVNVRDGFARNFLIPKQIAIETNSRAGKAQRQLIQSIQAKRAKRKSEAEDLKKRLADISLEFSLKIGRGGKSFGSISSKDVHEKLVSFGYELDRRHVTLPEPIKGVGKFEATVKLHSEVSCPIKLVVLADESSPAPEESKKEASPEKEQSEEEVAAAAEELLDSSDE